LTIALFKLPGIHRMIALDIETQIEWSGESSYSLTATHLFESLFCPRFTYFEYVLDIPQHEGKLFKVEIGRGIHEKARKMNPDYLRKKIGVKEKQSNVYLASKGGLRGIVDEILFFRG